METSRNLGMDIREMTTSQRGDPWLDSANGFASEGMEEDDIIWEDQEPSSAEPTAAQSRRPRPRGRPRKYSKPTPEPSAKISKGRSKTGCLTCRKRKKKCDETKPDCKNCEKNGVICEGYHGKTIWKSGKEKAEESRLLIQNACTPNSWLNGNEHNIPASNSSIPSSVAKIKRQRDDEEGGDDGDSSFRRPRKQAAKLGNSSSNPKLACPFRKHDSGRYSIHSHRVCALTPWDSISRLKQHLYRNHEALPYCKRCWQVFQSEEDLESHDTVSKREVCEISEGKPPEGITPKQAKDLKSKAKSWPGQNEEDKWREIYEKLFPNEDVPSPHYQPPQEERQISPDARLLADYDAYQQQELSNLVEIRIKEAARQAFPLFASVTVGDMDLKSIVRECQERVSRAYRTRLFNHSPRISNQKTPIFLDPPSNADLLTDRPLSGFFDKILHKNPPSDSFDKGLDFSSLPSFEDSHEMATTVGFSDSWHGAELLERKSLLPRLSQERELRDIDLAQIKGSPEGPKVSSCEDFLLWDLGTVEWPQVRLDGSSIGADKKG